MNDQSGFTIFGVLAFLGLLCGVSWCGQYGYRQFGLVGWLTGAVIGGVAGLWIGRIPYVLVSYSLQRSFDRQSTQQLRERLRSGREYYIAHLLLEELIKRGERVAEELPVLLALMKSESADRRRFGWGGLIRAFPAVAAREPPYRPMDSAENCRLWVSRLEAEAGQDRAEDPADLY